MEKSQFNFHSKSLIHLPDLCHHLILSFLTAPEVIRLTGLSKSYQQILITLPWCEEFNLNRVWLAALMSQTSSLDRNISFQHPPLSCVDWLKTCMMTAIKITIMNQTELKSLPDLRTRRFQEYDLPLFNDENCHMNGNDQKNILCQIKAAASITELIAIQCASCLTQRFKNKSTTTPTIERVILADQTSLNFWEFIVEHCPTPISVNHFQCNFAFNQIERLSFPNDSTIATIQFPSSGDVDNYLISRQRLYEKYGTQLIVGSFWVNLQKDLLHIVNRNDLYLLGQYIAEARADLIFFKFETDRKSSSFSSLHSHESFSNRRASQHEILTSRSTSTLHPLWIPTELRSQLLTTERRDSHQMDRGHPSNENLSISTSSTRSSDNRISEQEANRNSDHCIHDETSDEFNEIFFDFSFVKTIVFSGFNWKSQTHWRLFNLLRGKESNDHNTKVFSSQNYKET